MNANTRTALILGITGGIGGEVARTLLARGWHVRALHRNPEKAAHAAEGIGQRVEWIKGDAMNRDFVNFLPLGRSVRRSVQGANGEQSCYHGGGDGEASRQHGRPPGGRVSVQIPVQLSSCDMASGLAGTPGRVVTSNEARSLSIRKSGTSRAWHHFTDG